MGNAHYLPQSPLPEVPSRRRAAMARRSRGGAAAGSLLSRRFHPTGRRSAPSRSRTRRGSTTSCSRRPAKTLTTIAADPKHLGARIGLTAVLHTWGSALIPCKKRGRPSRLTPLRIAREISASLQAPSSGVAVRGEIRREHRSEVAAVHLSPPAPSFPWHRAQEALAKIYRPRATRAARSGDACETSGRGMVPLAPFETSSGGRIGRAGVASR